MTSINYLIPTDFSANALQAAQLGVVLSRKTSATVHLLHAYTAFRSGFQSAEQNEEDRLRALNEAREEMDVFVSQLLEQAGSQTSVEVVFFDGDLEESVSSFLEKTDVDLMIVGTNGASGFVENTWGSNAYNLVKNAEFPVLVVPPDIANPDLVSAAFFTDFKEGDNATLEMLGKTFGETLHHVILIHLGEEGSKDSGEQSLSEWKGQLQSSFSNGDLHHEWIEGEEAADVVNEIARRESVDLLVLTLVNRGFFESVFHKSLVKEVVHQAQVPIFFSGVYEKD